MIGPSRISTAADWALLIVDQLMKVAEVAVSLSAMYLYLLALAAARRRTAAASRDPRHRFAIAIPAHNEADVIGETVSTLLRLDYPRHLFDIHVVADHCTDDTAGVVRATGGYVHERNGGHRGAKGAALEWLFQRILGSGSMPGSAAPYDAVVVFDADTQVEPTFLRVMDARLAGGDQVIQGQHRISNPQDGWLPALVWAMFIVDNRFQNLGRSNLGWSAKHMGDSICFRAAVLGRLGWGEGLTEDYAFRQRLLLEGIRIRYEPGAIGRGEAPTSWRTAKGQRTRWLRGTHDASQRYGQKLFREGLRRRDLALLDGALQASLPSFSSLTLIALGGWLLQGILSLYRLKAAGHRRGPILNLWSGVLGVLFCYPFLGLAMDRAPFKAYQAILLGPLFVFWRTWLAVASRRQSAVTWVRTPRRGRSRTVQ